MATGLRTTFRFSAVILAISFSGCASLFSTSHVSFESNPPLPPGTINKLHNLVSINEVIGDGEEIIRLTATLDVNNITAFLRSLGYYDSRISHEISQGRNLPHVTYRINPGPRFQLDEINLVWPEHFDGPRLNVTNHPTSSAADVLAARSSVRRRLMERGYPDAQVTNETIIVDHAIATMHATFEIDPGRPAYFGNVQAEGLRNLRNSYITRATPWTPGDRFDIRQIELLEQRLAASGLFSSIQTSRFTEPEQDENIYDLKLRLRERKARVLQLGVGYRSDTGAETSAQWQHRNAFGGGENFIVRALIKEVGYETELRLIVPFFMRSDQQWGNSLKYSEEDTDAYESNALEAESWLSRDVNRRLTIRLGIAVRYLDEIQEDASEHFYLTSLPGYIIWDNSNDKLDATKGHRVILHTEPFQNIEFADQHFWKNLVTLHGFQPFNSEKSWMAALRVTAGSISGVSLNSVPADLRYYAGGGQSVRGYDFQSLSPRDEDSIVGGLSLMETSLEIRGRLNRSFGLVVFLDGGSAFEEQWPDFSESFRWGTGAGIRYFSPVGPLRLDVGFPLNRRDSIDDSWQFYISIGQAF